MSPSTISFLLEKTEANCMKQRKPIGFEMSRAEEKYGVPISVREAQITWTETVSFFSAVAVRIIWLGVFFVPFLLACDVVIARAGLYAFVNQYENSLANGDRFEMFETGVHLLFHGGNTSLRLHMVGKTTSKPCIEVSIRQIF
ncbi:MAG: hypothetical protein COT25_02130 [Candidatus Kerfeldbacteria bacterium CG08_land_8_20_14_0_20_42_7]|uniref:Uncharacterized protein n=1 Tax=Candidatus Kerfeldbacteria bacterium CG08_land_8_20_14_0_20_42_7 TaxID=2014245 RepID=A0A2H0YT56_9BACT|nr:MAG: hypothetical protein COT25_02130 [Candidatus Kerfeldbacteria bacterium CG08_land_8_20_14_0_20_42_7]